MRVDYYDGEKFLEYTTLEWLEGDDIDAFLERNGYDNSPDTIGGDEFDAYVNFFPKKEEGHEKWLAELSFNGNNFSWFIVEGIGNRLEFLRKYGDLFVFRERSFVPHNANGFDGCINKKNIEQVYITYQKGSYIVWISTDEGKALRGFESGSRSLCENYIKKHFCEPY